MKRNTKDAAWLKEFSKRVKARMAELEINQAKLVKLTGLSQQEVSLIMNGSHVPLATNVVKVARALIMDVSDLIDFEVNA